MIKRCRRMMTVTTLSFVLLLFAASVAGAKTTIRIAQPYDETHKVHEAMLKVAAGFEARYPEYSVQVESSYSGEKVKIAVATNDPPDIYYQWLCVPWGADGLFQPLNSYIAKYGIKSGDFVPAAWNQNIWQGNIYALPLHIDTNFALLWNKDHFGEAGLNPDVPPKTTTQFDDYFKKLTRSDSAGTPQRLAMVPWYVYGNPNTVFTWGWIFGGDFYDYVNDKATAHDPRIVQALEYIADYYSGYLAAFNSLNQGINSTGYGSYTIARVANGRDSMAFTIPSGYFAILENFPNLDIGTGMMFVHPGSDITNPTWIGGFSLGILTGAKQPEAAFELIRYMTSDPEGIALYAETANHMPANIMAPALRKLGADPKWRVFTEIAVSTVRFRPAIPVLESYQQQLGAILPKVLSKQVTAQGALEELSKIVDATIADRYRK
jgi:multiple sugar transport system substrate-binding protein